MIRTPEVFVVADDNAFQQMLVVLLDEKGFDVKGADSAELEDCTDSMDIVLVDGSIADLYGVCRQLRELNSARSVPIIAFTQSDSDAIERACNAGADSYLTKPFEPQSLLVKIIQILSMSPDSLIQNHIC